MNFAGIDYHKRYSVASAVNERGELVREARIEGNTREGFEAFFRSLGGPCRVVVEACWNWGTLYDTLEGMEGVEEVVLSHPYKTRVIAEAQVKTDKLDARALAQLLRGNLIARAWIPSLAARHRKDVLRQRIFWVRMRTRLRNRVHALLGRHQRLEMPQVSDVFGVRGMSALRKLELPEPDRTLLRQELEVLELLKAKVRELETQVERENQADPRVRLLETIPGLGKILAAVVMSEIDQVERFSRMERLWAYAGLAPTTHASGGKVYHGRLMPMCNKWLRWAFVEAAWVAMGCSAYFGSLYRQHRARGKSANIAIIIVARRIAQIVWKMLKDQRPYQEHPVNHPLPDRSRASLVAA